MSCFSSAMYVLVVCVGMCLLTSDSNILGAACRSRVIKLAAKFKTPSDASRHFCEAQGKKLGRDNGNASATSEMQVSPPESSVVPTSEKPPCTVPSGDLSVVLKVCQQTLDSLQPNQQLQILSQLFSLISQMSVPSDFLELANHGMHHLKEHGRSNLIYQLARCVGTMRADGSDSLLPVKRMPTGLIEYAVNFFNARIGTKVHANILLPTHGLSLIISYSLCKHTGGVHYKLQNVATNNVHTLWYQVGFKIHAGRVWSVDTVAQGESNTSHTLLSPVEVCIITASYALNG